MKKLPLMISAILILSVSVEAQNLIDHIGTYWPSGYGKMAFDGDTLYLNTMNGRAVERYYIADPVNPVFIDREEVSGFEQIDFERRVMARSEGIIVKLFDFENFSDVQPLSNISIEQYFNWKLNGEYFVVISRDDSIRTYSILNPANPELRTTFRFYRERPIGSYISVAFGSDIVVISYSTGYMLCNDVYDIRNPEAIVYSYSDSIHTNMGGGGVIEANGDTVAIAYWTVMLTSQLWFSQYWPDHRGGDIRGFGSSGPYQQFCLGRYGFMYTDLMQMPPRVYSYSNMSIMGRVDLPDRDAIHYEADVVGDENYYTAFSNSLKIYQATFSENPMPLVDSMTPPHCGIFSSCSYENYLLAGAESNAGELLVQAIDDDGEINQIASLAGVPAKDIIIDGTIAFCICSNKLVVVDLIDPGHPLINNEMEGFSGPLVDFARQDSLIFVVTDHTYYIINFNITYGFTLLSSLVVQGGQLSGLAQARNASYLLKGEIGVVEMINATNPANPYISQERRLPYSIYSNIEQFQNTIWVSGPDGTDIISAYIGMDSVAFVGPEYFSDVRKIYLSNDTLYVADGVNGLKVFTFSGHPYSGLRYIGGYKTGNVVNQIARVERNFYISDYYSLQHLRWGAPDGIGADGESVIPDGLALEQNYPNPFNNETSISYIIPVGEQSTLNIYDICGRSVRAIPVKGSGNIVWNGRDEADKPVSSGVYFYKIAGQPETARKMLLVK
jgi:hypothetical protein